MSSALAFFADCFLVEGFVLAGVFFFEDSAVGVFGAFNFSFCVVLGVFAGYCQRC